MEREKENAREGPRESLALPSLLLAQVVRRGLGGVGGATARECNTTVSLSLVQPAQAARPPARVVARRYSEAGARGSSSTAESLTVSSNGRTMATSLVDSRR